MSWDKFGTGVAILALGVALLLGVPPPGWPNMPIALQYTAWISGLLICLGSFGLLLWGFRPTKIFRMGPTLAMIIGGALFLFGLWWHFKGPLFSASEEREVAPTASATPAPLPTPIPASSQVPPTMNANTSGPNSPVYQNTAIQTINNGANTEDIRRMLREELTQLNRSSGPDFRAEFPLGYAIFAATTNVVVPFVAAQGEHLEADWSIARADMIGPNVIVYLPQIRIGNLRLTSFRIQLYREPGSIGELPVDINFRGEFADIKIIGSHAGQAAPNTYAMIIGIPNHMLTAKIVSLQPGVDVVVLGLKPM